MKQKKSRTKTDPELVRQIKAAKPDSKSVQAVFTLHLPHSKAASSDEVSEITRSIVDKAESSVGKKVDRIKVFGNLGAFIVSADASLIEELIEADDVDTAVANQQPDSMKITE